MIDIDNFQGMVRNDQEGYLEGLSNEDYITLEELFDIVFKNVESVDELKSAVVYAEMPMNSAYNKKLRELMEKENKGYN